MTHTEWWVARCRGWWLSWRIRYRAWRGGGTVFVPKGVYILPGDRIYPPKGVMIVGESVGAAPEPKAPWEPTP